jgi:hypothetical protein
MNFLLAFFFFFFNMFTQGKGEDGFEIVISASLDMVYSQLNYPLRTDCIFLTSNKHTYRL